MSNMQNMKSLTKKLPRKGVCIQREYSKTFTFLKKFISNKILSLQEKNILFGDKNPAIQLVEEAEKPPIERDLLKMFILIRTFKDFDYFISYHQIPEEILRYALAFVECVKYKRNEIIFKQGEPSQYFYLIIQGSVVIKEAIKKSDGEIEINDKITLKEGACFGEYGLINNLPRGHTVVALDKINTVLRLSKNVFNQYFHRFISQTESKRKIQIQRLIPCFQELSYKKFIYYYNFFIFKKIYRGEFIYHENTIADKVFLILNGRCKFIKNNVSLFYSSKQDVVGLEAIDYIVDENINKDKEGLDEKKINNNMINIINSKNKRNTNRNNSYRSINNIYNNKSKEIKQPVYFCSLVTVDEGFVICFRMTHLGNLLPKFKKDLEKMKKEKQEIIEQYIKRNESQKDKFDFNYHEKLIKEKICLLRSNSKSDAKLTKNFSEFNQEIDPLKILEKEESQKLLGKNKVNLKKIFLNLRSNNSNENLMNCFSERNHFQTLSNFKIDKHLLYENNNNYQSNYESTTRLDEYNSDRKTTSLSPRIKTERTAFCESIPFFSPMSTDRNLNTRKRSIVKNNKIHFKDLMSRNAKISNNFNNINTDNKNHLGNNIKTNNNESKNLLLNNNNRSKVFSCTSLLSSCNVSEKNNVNYQRYKKFVIKSDGIDIVKSFFKNRRFPKAKINLKHGNQKVPNNNNNYFFNSGNYVLPLMTYLYKNKI